MHKCCCAWVVATAHGKLHMADCSAPYLRRAECCLLSLPQETSTASSLPPNCTLLPAACRQLSVKRLNHEQTSQPSTNMVLVFLATGRMDCTDASCQNTLLLYSSGSLISSITTVHAVSCSTQVRPAQHAVEQTGCPPKHATACATQHIKHRQVAQQPADIHAPIVSRRQAVWDGPAEHVPTNQVIVLCQSPTVQSPKVHPSLPAHLGAALAPPCTGRQTSRTTKHFQRTAAGPARVCPVHTHVRFMPPVSLTSADGHTADVLIGCQQVGYSRARCCCTQANS